MRKPGLAIMIAVFAASTGSAFAVNNAGEGNAAMTQVSAHLLKVSAHQKKNNETVEYKRAQKRIKADYAADKSICSEKQGETKRQCLKQAKARKKHAMADARKANKKAQAAGQH